MPQEEAGVIRLLGPVEATGARGPARLAAAERAMLAALALGGPQAVAGARLAEALGVAESEIGPLSGRLSAALARAGLAGAVTRTGRGHLLRLPVDVDRFRRDVRAARDLMPTDPAAAVAGLEAALRRWRTREPAAGCRLAGWAEQARSSLSELRLTALEDRWDAVLREAAAAVRAAGAPLADRAALAAEAAAVATGQAAIEALSPEAEARPLRERVCELLMIAHAITGHRRAGLRRYAATERAFAGQLGVAPSERLREVAAAVRAGELGDRAAPPDLVPEPPPGPAVFAPLPVPLTPLIGRDALLCVLADRLAGHRLVTLTGPGGAGKTRLAVAAAAREAGDEAWFVDLSAVDSPVRVPAVVAAALGVRDESGRDAVDGTADRIGPGRRLLVLDNCERLVAGCAELVDRLLDRCPGLRVLATSRAPLGSAAEVVLPVPPLAVPAPRAAYRVADLARVPAARLFLDRAAARSGRPVPESAAGAVAQLCVELDGLPLALELAAARTPLLSVPELVARLRGDVGLLRSSDPNAPARHRTLVAAVESSLAPLGPQARELLRRLSVFSGGFDADGAGAVHPAGARLLPVLAAASLVEPIDPRPAAPSVDLAVAQGSMPVKSDIVTCATARSTKRYRMLAPIRRCAAAMLVEAGEEPAVLRAHATYHLALAERAEPHLRGPDRDGWLARLTADWANVRAALAWLAEAGAAGPPHGDLRLAAAVATYCYLRGQYRDGRGWLIAAMARHPAAPADLRARAATGAALLSMLLSEYAEARRHASVAAAACRDSGDLASLARVETILGAVAREQARYAEAAAHCDAAAARYADCGDPGGQARAVQMGGFVAWLAGDLEVAEPRLRDCLRRFDSLGDAEAGAAAVVHLGAVAHYRGDSDRAAALLDAGLERYAALGFPEGVAWAHDLRGRVDLRGGRLDRAAVHLGRSLTLHRSVGDRWRTASLVEGMAELARLRDAPGRAAALLAHAAAIRDAIDAPVPACERAGVAASEAAVRAVLGDERYGWAAATGRSATLDELLGPGELPVDAEVVPVP